MEIIKRIFNAAWSFNQFWNTKILSKWAKIWRDNLSKIKDEAYIINPDEYSDIGTHCIALYVHNNYVTYFDSFGVEHIPKEIRAFIDRSLSITTNIFRIQAYDSIMCGCFCIGFIHFMLAWKTLTGYTNLLSPNKFKEYDDVILNYFMSNI